MKVKGFVSNFDFILFISVVILAVIGIFFIYSANYNKYLNAGVNQGSISNHVKQTVFLIVNIMILISVLFIPSKYFIRYSLYFYLFCLLGLLITVVFPVFIKGQKRLQIGGMALQFSEFMKIAVILFLAFYYSIQSREQIKKLLTYLIGVVIVGIPAFFILLQPDLGTLLVYIPIFFAISFFAGVPKRYLLYSLLLLAMIAFYPIITSINKMFFNNEHEIINLFNNIKYITLILSALGVTLVISLFCLYFIKGLSYEMKRIFYWIVFFDSIIFLGLLISIVFDRFILDDYQKDRIMIFFNPQFDPKVRGYHIIQSQLTIGNGGVFGKGWCQGEMIQKLFLPEHDTDFIYPVIAEEKGFLGSIIILILYSILFTRGFLITLNTREYWESYIVIGILAMYLYHILQNIGMAVGIMPITGIPLPFLSYGGSFLTTCFLGIAIMINIKLNRYQF